MGRLDIFKSDEGLGIDTVVSLWYQHCSVQLIPHEHLRWCISHSGQRRCIWLLGIWLARLDTCNIDDPVLLEFPFTDTGTMCWHAICQCLKEWVVGSIAFGRCRELRPHIHASHSGHRIFSPLHDTAIQHCSWDDATARKRTWRLVHINSISNEAMFGAPRSNMAESQSSWNQQQSQ